VCHIRQGITADRILGLYRWYKFERPNRPDLHDLPFRERYEEEERREDEDTEKAQEVLSLRRSMWT
jgi:hypothetical protein